MARYEFKLPDIGEGVTEGEIKAWLVQPGDVVKDDQPMVEVATDKATVVIAAPKAGKVVELKGAVGAIIQVHAVLVVFELDGAGAPAAAAPPLAKKDSGPAATAVGDIREDLPGMNLGARPAPAAASVPAPASAGYFNEKPLATPATRKLARDKGIDLRAVAPTGPSGRVTQADVEAHAGGSGAHASAAPQVAGSGAPGAPSSGAPGAPHASASAAEPTPNAAAMAPLARTPVKIASPAAVAGEVLEERTALRGVRKRIFENMARSKHTAAHFTFVEECDVTELKALREKLRAPAEKQGVKLSFLPFIVKAVVAALKRHPSINGAFDESTNEVVTRRYYNIGIASATEQGLTVPVVKQADRRSILDIAREIQRLSDDTKNGKAKLEDLQGSTFTITSLGAQGGLFATPIVNFPEVAILGVHQMKRKPVVRGDEIVIGDVMLLSLSFDHRIIDGHVGAAFAYEVIGFLQDPDRLLLEA